VRLNAAAFAGDLEGIEDALSLGAHVEATGTRSEVAATRGQTPLCHAVERGHAGAVRLLLEAEAEVNVRTPFAGEVPVHLAVRFGHEEILGLLLRAKADATCANSRGLTPLQLAEQDQREEAIAVLRSHLGLESPTGREEEEAPEAPAWGSSLQPWRTEWPMWQVAAGPGTTPAKAALSGSLLGSGLPRVRARPLSAPRVTRWAEPTK